jgi:ABC-2 type transport system permease protein
MVSQTVITEFIKLRRSRITWISWLAYSMMPIVGALFVWIIMEPERAGQLGLLGQKAEFVGMSADWTGYFGLLLQTTGIGGMILVSVITSFVFGREYSDETAKNMLTLPVKRHLYIIAKLVVIFVWFSILTLSLLGEGIVICFIMDLPGYSTSLMFSQIGDILLASTVAWLLIPVIAWISLIGKGYLAPMGFTIFLVILGNVFGATGWGKWFPWSIVPLFAGVAGPRNEVLAPESIFIVLLIFIVGTIGAALQLRLGDNTQ